MRNSLCILSANTLNENFSKGLEAFVVCPNYGQISRLIVQWL